ncbi:MAG: hypothetical protein JXA79_05090 [Deltaproteobacteria bacterium]|nr:hypothetical protein [Deltaproteobacteria bacterium]
MENEIKKRRPTTLLRRFIFDRAVHYDEPQRRGTPRGETVGLSYTKYLASLWMITSEKQKEIAEALGVSYGLLRKWNTEETFKEAVETNRRDFVRYFTGHIEDRCELHAQSMDRVLCKPVEEIVTTKSLEELSFGYEEYQDGNIYSIELVSEICDALLKKIKNMEDQEKITFVLECDAVLGALKFYSGENASPVLEEELKKRRERFAIVVETAWLMRIRDFLLKNETSEEDRRETVLFLSMMIQHREEMLKGK